MERGETAGIEGAEKVGGGEGAGEIEAKGLCGPVAWEGGVMEPKCTYVQYTQGEPVSSPND